MEVRCDNILGFDASTNQYKVCNQRLKVSSDKIGKRLMCPKCKQPIRIQPESDGNDLAVPLQAPENPAPTPLRQQENVMEMDFQTTAQLRPQSTTFASKKRCSQCGGQFNAKGICEVCGYVEPVQAAERRHKNKEKDRPAGFQFWLQSMASEGVSMRWIGIGVFALAFLFCLVVMAGGILAQTILGALVTALFGFVLIFVCMLSFTSWQIANDNNASLGVLAPLWDGVLFAARFYDWQKYDSRLKGRKIIDLRKNPIDDSELASLQDLRVCQVLDLEGSEITDMGLKALYPLTQLRCLVLKNTQVSREAVTMLQQHRPVLWIWM